MEPNGPGIPTMHQGTLFRSRLEARWAAMFGLIGWRWTYEPLDADGYIPDFLIHGEWPFFVEVGPCIVPQDYLAKREKPAASRDQLRHDVLVVGVSAVAGFARSTGRAVAGLLGEYSPASSEAGLESLMCWGFGLWTKCDECRAVSVIHDQMSYCVRGCGHHLSGGLGEPVGRDWIEALWRRAGNDVQWRGPQRVGDLLAGAR